MIGAALLGALLLARGRELVRPPGNVHPLLAAARPLGPAPEGGPMERMILALRLAPEAETRLELRLADLQDSASRDYHRWLTPERFGEQFGPRPEDLERITAWLRAGGLRIDEVAAGRLSITFSGTVAQVERTFRTPIRRFEWDGAAHQGNVLDPAIPRELAGLVAGVVSLHDFPRAAQNVGFRPAPGQGHNLAPGDFAAIYNVNPLYREGVDGSGVSVAVVGRTRIALADTARFRQAFGLPPRPPEIIVNGADPGDLGGGEEGEANLDVQWAGAVARNAGIRLVVSASTAATDGVDLSAQYIVNHNLAPVLSDSFGQCEPRMGSAAQTFYQHLWAQAAAQGITAVVAAGDSGPAGCDGGNQSSGSGRAVSGLASTPYDVAVGGTQFDEGSGCYWKDRPDPEGASAMGYIPERAWNESAGAGGSGLWAGGGGSSSLYPKPGWQVAPGVPANGGPFQYRCLPDVALAAAAHHDGYVIETGGSRQVTGGTSCSAPAFAGLMALVVQRSGRQGNPNPALYRLGSAQYRGVGPVVFHDVLAGATCVPGTQGYDARPAYDLATGLGSVDAQALAGAWEAGNGNNVDAVIGQPGTDRTVAAGGAVTFRGSARSSEPAAALTYAWDFGDGGAGTGATCTHVYSNPGPAPITNLVTFTARDGTGAQGSDTRAITVLAPPAPGELILDGGFELGRAGWTGHGVAIGDNGPPAPAHQGTASAWFPGGRRAPGVLLQTVRIPAGAAAARLTFWLRVDTRETAPAAVGPFEVKARGADGRIKVLSSTRGLQPGLGYQLYSLDLDPYRGQTVQISFVAPGVPCGRGSGFALDDVSLIAK